MDLISDPAIFCSWIDDLNLMMISWWIHWWHYCVYCWCSRLHVVLSQRPAFILAILYELCSHVSTVSNQKKNQNWPDWNENDSKLRSEGLWESLSCLLSEQPRILTSWYLLILPLLTGLRQVWLHFMIGYTLEIIQWTILRAYVSVCVSI